MSDVKTVKELNNLIPFTSSIELSWTGLNWQFVTESYNNVWMWSAVSVMYEWRISVSREALPKNKVNGQLADCQLVN